MRGAAYAEFINHYKIKISTHAPHARRGGCADKHEPKSFQFLLTRLMRGAATAVKYSLHSSQFLLTRLMRGAAINCKPKNNMLFISTHAPHARRGRLRQQTRTKIFSISTHAPHARRGYLGPSIFFPRHLFLLTRLMRGAARIAGCFRRISLKFLLTRLMRGAACHIPVYVLCHSLFLLTRLMRGAASAGSINNRKNRISTHAPHARRGAPVFQCFVCQFNFYSRASCEARQGADLLEADLWDFYSRASCEARLRLKTNHSSIMISTHAPHARRGRGANLRGANLQDFYSRASCEARHRNSCRSPMFPSFLLTRLMRGAAASRFIPDTGLEISTHAPHARRGLDSLPSCPGLERFLLTRLMRGAAIAIPRV